MYVESIENIKEKNQEQKFEQLVHQFHRPIYRYCYNILRNRHDADDATQEVFVKAFQRDNIHEIDHRSAWLYKIAYNLCINKVRRNKILTFTPFTEKAKAEIGTGHGEHYIDSELHYIMAKLSPKERAIIVLRVIEDKEFNEVADILGINIATARKRYERVRMKVKKIIERRTHDEKE